MISLDKARRMKELGLKWEPKKFDLFTNGDEVLVVLYTETGLNKTLFIKTQYGLCMGDGWIWLPRLEQLLAEIERHVKFVKITKLIMEKKWLALVDGEQFMADDPADAAADALIWIISQKEGDKND